MEEQGETSEKNSITLVTADQHVRVRTPPRHDKGSTKHLTAVETSSPSIRNKSGMRMAYRYDQQKPSATGQSTSLEAQVIHVLP